MPSLHYQAQCLADESYEAKALRIEVVALLYRDDSTRQTHHEAGRGIHDI